MLRVSKVEDWLHRAPTRPDLSTRSDCVIIRSGEGNGTGPEAASGVSSQTSGSQALRLRLVMIPPRTRGMPHFHADHESAIYTVSGETEIWHGDGLVKRTIVRAGDFMYVPPGTPHLAVNRGSIMTIAVAASTDPEEREDVVVVELPRHLAGLLCLPVAVRELPPKTPRPPPAGSGESGISWRRHLLLRRLQGFLSPLRPDKPRLAAVPAGVAAGTAANPVL